MEESKKSGGLLGGLFGLLLIAYIVLAIIDYCGIFVKGTYTNDDEDLILDSKGKVIDDKYEITYFVHGKDIKFYRDGEELLRGTIQNGVITFTVWGVEVNYYKDGDTSLDRTQKSAVDYVRTIVSPLSKLIYDVLN